jgi:acyl-CoA dehydrogenase
VVKGWSTETGIDVASLGVQVHGGMGFVEETGAAQYLRDARITTIYEGTTGIQAMDLVGRKIARDGGRTVRAWLDEVRKSPGMEAGVRAVSDCVDFITASRDPRATFAGAVPFLKLMGVVAGGWQMAIASSVSQEKLSSGNADKAFLEAKIVTARFYAENVLVQASGLRDMVVKGAGGVMALSDEQFLAA